MVSCTTTTLILEHSACHECGRDALTLHKSNHIKGDEMSKIVACAD